MSEQQDSGNNNNGNNNNEQKPFRRQHYGRDKRIKAIQRASLKPVPPNGFKKEITYEQALSILLRSRQLIREGAYHPHLISDEEKARQIEECYMQRAREKAG